MKKNLVFFLFIVLGIAAIIRLGHIIAIQSSPLGNRLFVDSEIYDTWANEILNKGFMGDKPFYQDPLYPYFLALFYSIFGRNLFIIRLIQVLAGVFICYLIYRITCLIFNNQKAGVFSSLISAIYLPFIFYEGEVEKTALGVFIVTLFVWSFIKAYKKMTRVRTFSSKKNDSTPKHTERTEIREKASNKFGILRCSSLINYFKASKQQRPFSKTGWIIPGIFLGLATLVRSNIFLLGIGILVLFAIKKQIRPLIMFIIGLSIILVPVSIRNSILAKEFIFTTTQAGQNFYIGNSPYNNNGQYSPPPWIRPHPRFEEEDFRSYAENRFGRHLRFSEVSNFYLKESFSFIFSNLGKFLKVLGKKFLLYFNNHEVPDNQDIGFVALYSPILKIPLLQFGIILALAIAGLFSIKTRDFNRRDSRDNRDKKNWFFSVDNLLWSGFLLFAISVIAFFVFSRYRIPAVPFIMPYAGFGLWRIIEYIKKKDWKGLKKPLIIFSGVLIFSLIPLKTNQELRLTRAQCFANLAARFYQEGNTEKAISVYHKALEVASFHVNSLRDLGVIYFNLKDFQKAEELLARSLKINPHHPDANFYLAKVYDAAGKLTQALEYYEKAKQVQPGNLEIQFNMGTVFQKLGRYKEAISLYESALGRLKIAPSNHLIYHNLSVAYFNLKDYNQAKIYLDRAKSLGLTPNPNYEKALNEALNR